MSDECQNEPFPTSFSPAENLWRRLNAWHRAAVLQAANRLFWLPKCCRNMSLPAFNPRIQPPYSIRVAKERKEKTKEASSSPYPSIFKKENKEKKETLSRAYAREVDRERVTKLLRLACTRWAGGACFCRLDVLPLHHGTMLKRRVSLVVCAMPFLAYATA